MFLFNSQKKQPQQPQIVRTVSYPNRAHGVAQRQQPVTRHSKLPALFVMVGLLTAAGFIFGLPGHKGGSVQGVNTSEVQAATPKPEVVQKLDFTSMNTAINAEIQKYPYMDIGVAIIDIKTGDSQTYGVQNPFVAASTAKLLTAIAYLHDVEQGKATLAQSVGTRTAQDALKAMIIDSDNEAWNDFNNGVMSHAELAQYANSIGIANYNPDTNTITPASVATLLSDLYQHKLINKEHTDLLLSYMAQAKEVEFITNTISAGIKVYHKPGYLADRVHDAAIIDDGKRPYVLVIFSKSRSAGYDMSLGATLFKQITLATTGTFVK